MNPIGDRLEHKQDVATIAGANLKHVREREWPKRNRLRHPASFKAGHLAFVHHSRLPSGR